MGVPVETSKSRAEEAFRNFVKAADRVSPPEPTFRPATEADIPSLMDIEHKSFPDNPYPAEVFKNWIGAGEHGSVAELGGKPVGYLMHRDDDKAPGFRYGHSLAVHPDHRRAGVGKALMTKFTSEYPNTSADVDTDNAASKGLLKKLGFKARRTFKEKGRRRHRYERSQEEKKADLTQAALAAAASETDTEPTDAQKEAGNYKKGRAAWKGLTLVIENPKGSVRSGKDWQITMKDHYGYVAGTESGADGDAVDFFLNPDHLDSEIVFVVNQKKKDGGFDEHKCVLGCVSREEAEKTYLRNYSPGWTGMGEVTPITLDHFKWWLENADTSKEIKNGYFAAAENRRPMKKAAADPATGHQETDEEFWNRNEASKERNKDNRMGHIRDGYIPCGGCGYRYHEMPEDEKCPTCGYKLGVRLRSMRRPPKVAFDSYEPRMVLVKRARDAATPFTICVDLDGTLAEKEEPFDPDSIGPPIEKAVGWVRRFHKNGARIIIFTVRGDTALVTDWLTEHEVPFDYVNENPDQPEDASGKILADVYWDDRAFNAVDPDEHGPEILRLAKEHAGEDEPVSVTGTDLLDAMEGDDEQQERGTGVGHAPARPEPAGAGAGRGN